MSILRIVEITISILLIVSVLLQTRGSQLGIAFGMSSETYRSKRGLEKLLFYSTIILSVLFGSLAIVNLVLK